MDLISNMFHLARSSSWSLLVIVLGFTIIRFDFNVAPIALYLVWTCQHHGFMVYGYGLHPQKNSNWVCSSIRQSWVMGD
jgi:hypothetical protein